MKGIDESLLYRASFPPYDQIDMSDLMSLTYKSFTHQYPIK